MAKNGTNYKNKRISLISESPKRTESLVHGDFGGNDKISFSFEYFEQRDLFGYGNQSSSWFASLHERLADMSTKTKKILLDKDACSQYRVHIINWEAENIPITLDELERVPVSVKGNIKENPFIQFQLSKSLGRVIGFFSQQSAVFYIVLLDPKHNLQPSIKNDRKIDDTLIASTPYQLLNKQLAYSEKRKNTCPHNSQCPLTKIHDEYLKTDLFYAVIDEALRNRYEQLIKGGSFQQKFEDFLMAEYLNS